MCTQTQECLWCSDNLWEKTLWTPFRESCHKQEVTLSGAFVWSGTSERHYCSCACIAFYERQRPEQGRPVCLAVSALRVPLGVKKPNLTARLQWAVSAMWAGENSDWGLMRWEEERMTLGFEDIGWWSEGRGTYKRRRVAAAGKGLSCVDGNNGMNCLRQLQV